MKTQLKQIKKQNKRKDLLQNSNNGMAPYSPWKRHPRDWFYRTNEDKIDEERLRKQLQKAVNNAGQRNALELD
jgi:hypothetical protein